MKSYDDYLLELDTSTYDYGDKTTIDDKLKAILTDATNESNADIEYNTRKELEVLSYQKSIKRGITPQANGIGKTKEGNEVVITWPNIQLDDEKAWGFIEARYVSLKNLYCKYQFGMLLFLSEKKKDNDRVTELLNINYSLCETYYNKALDDRKNNTHYALYLSLILSDGIELSIKRKKGSASIQGQFETLKNFIYKILLDWDVSNKGSLRIVLDLTKIISEHFPEFKDLDLVAVLEKNWAAAIKQGETYGHGAISIAENADKLAQKLAHDRVRWHRLIGESYEKMADDRGDMVAPEFLAKAMQQYKLIGDKAKLKALHLKLNEAKKNLNLSTYSYEMTKNDSDNILNNLRSQLKDQATNEIIADMASGVMLPTFTDHKERQTKNPVFTFAGIASTMVFDKFGNKNITLGPENIDDDSSYYSSYALAFQIPSQIFFTYFIEAIRSGKLTSEDIISWFKRSWFGEEIIRVYNGGSKSVVILDLLEPSIRNIFSEFERHLRPSLWSRFKKMIGITPKESKKSVFVCAIDSLAPKIEYVLRIMLEEKMGIPTTYVKEDSTWEEQTLTALLITLKDYLKDKYPDNEHLIDDVQYIEFIMNHKAGFNFRNKVSHSHMDVGEYNPHAALLILSVYLRVSTYSFTK